MTRKYILAALCTLLAIVSFNSQAMTTGPDYPPPGGVTFNGNGVSGADGTAVWNYTNLDSNARPAIP
jgi:hypothetical protein